MTNLDNKVFLITGASKGIGYYLVERALKSGAKVIATTRDIRKFENSELSASDNFIPVGLDFQAKDSLDKLMSTIESLDLCVDILINNAGVAHFKTLNDMDIAEISETIDVNFKSTVALTKLLLPAMIERKSGVIANILSGAIERNFPYSSVYSGTKSAIRAMSRSLREEIRDKNIKVIDILPGATSTEIWDKYMLDKYADRMIHPKDLAEVILSNISMSYLPNIMIEDIIIKPQLGDL